MALPSIRDVANAAGVSTATVSRTLSSPEQVSEETRQTVMAAVQLTGYRVNRAARNLRKCQSGEVLVLVPNLSNPFFSQILAGIEKTFSGTDYNILIADSRGMKQGEDLLAEHLANTRADGIILLDGCVSPTVQKWLDKNAQRHHAVFACEWQDGTSLPVVQSNNRAGAAMAIRYLHELGHRQIAHVTGPLDNVLTRVRREGALEEYQRLQLPINPDWIIRGDFSLNAGHRAAQHIIAMTERPSAVFCASDQIAFGLISGLYQAGLRVPEDISVMGFDDIELSEFYIPRLTTIRQNRPILGATAAQLVLDRLNGTASKETTTQLIEVELIVRDSCAAPVPSLSLDLGRPNTI